MRKLLWIGDADVATGFARCTHHVLDVLRKDWEVHVLGLNYRGDPHLWPYPIYPCWPGGDMFGLGRLPELLERLRPGLIVIQNDPWNIPEYLMRVQGIPVVATMPVDGKNCDAGKLNSLALAIFWTQFGLDEARLGGYERPAAVIPLGVDLDVYRPVDRRTARREVALPAKLDEAFIVGNINRNQPRKRLDLTMEYFAEWVNSEKINDAFLYLHIAPTTDQGYEPHQLMQYYGFRGDRKRLIITQPEVGKGSPEGQLANVYSCFDAQITTTQGEGWGLTTMEGMACGVPQIVPNWAALGEWTEDTVIKVECDHRAVTPNGANVIGGIMNKKKAIEGLNRLYGNRSAREELASKGLALVRQDRFRWPVVGEAFARALDLVHVKGTEDA